MKCWPDIHLPLFYFNPCKIWSPRLSSILTISWQYAQFQTIIKSEDISHFSQFSLTFHLQCYCVLLLYGKMLWENVTSSLKVRFYQVASLSKHFSGPAGVAPLHMFIFCFPLIEMRWQYRFEVRDGAKVKLLLLTWKPVSAHLVLCLCRSLLRTAVSSQSGAHRDKTKAMC